MATTGKDAWEKYFKGGDIETIIKKDSSVYDIINKTKIIGELSAGQKVIVIHTASYEARPIIKYESSKKTYKVRIQFDSLQKPGTRGGSNPNNVKTISNKVLAPTGLGLGGKTVLKSQYINTINQSIDESKLVAPHIKDFLKLFLEKSKTSYSVFPRVIGISDKDIAIIAKDFGEIAGAWWFLNNYDNDIMAIKFPALTNEPLVDYYGVYKNKLNIGVSAKSEGGAAASLKSVSFMINESQSKSLGPHEKDIYNFINAVVDNDGRNGIIQAAKAAKSPLYNMVGKIVGKTNYNNTDIETWCNQFKEAEAAHTALTELFYSNIRRSALLDTFIKIWSSKKQKSGIILSPMAYALIDEVNLDQKNTKFLTDVIRTNNIEQLYVYLRNNSLKYEVNGFKNSNFVFEYHSNAADPGGNKIGFKLKK